MSEERFEPKSGRLKRFFSAGLVFVGIGLPICIALLASQDQKPWLIALGIYLVVASVVSNRYIFGSGRGSLGLPRWLTVGFNGILFAALGFLTIISRNDIRVLMIAGLAMAVIAVVEITSWIRNRKES